jgi:2-methylisocitrate lyase-like PEP mutase family enzyme
LRVPIEWDLQLYDRIFAIRGNALTDIYERAVKFRKMHEKGTFMMPNAWDAGSAKTLAKEGFPAIATTSAGIAFSLGKPDYVGVLSRDENMAAITAISQATACPVSADTEDCYGRDGTGIQETIRMTLAAGAVGASIEDSPSDGTNSLYDIEEAVERVVAAVEAADSLDCPLTLTARAECYLTGHPDALNESIKRLNRYAEAGAHCLYAPGPTDRATLELLVREVDGPINVVAGFSANSLSIAELAEIGVRRISNGGVLARLALASLQAAACEMQADGTFSFAGDAIPDNVANGIMAADNA